MATEYTIRPLLLSSLFLQMSAKGQKVEIFLNYIKKRPLYP
jgi:hypothetical protein